MSQLITLDAFYKIQGSVVQLTISLNLVGFAVSGLIYGPLSDHYGRRPMMLIGMTIFTLASVMCYIADSIMLLILIRFIQGAGAGVAGVVGYAAIRDMYSGSEYSRVISKLNMVVALSPGIAPGILLASTSLSYQALFLLVLFTIGAFLMRPAGCIINDIFDRKIDAHVERTKYRPLASGALNIKQALALLSLLLSIALVILLLTNKTTLILGIISMCMIATYPLLKRYVWWPQLFLGFTFNMGSLMGSAAITNQISIESLLFYIGCVFWTLSYDTIYAHQDKKDDEKLGMKSTALYFGDTTKSWLKRFYLISLMTWLYAGILSSLNNIFYIALLAVGFIFHRQYKNFNPDDPSQCMSIFKNNSYVGLLLFFGILLDRIIT